MNSEYNTLGVPTDAADSIIVQKYYDDKLCGDRKQHPRLLECLQQIGIARSSDAIQGECAMELSRGCYNQQAVLDSYRALGLDWKSDSKYDDQYILGIFNSRLEDMRMHERELRDNLHVIGDHRDSRTLIDAAANSEFTYNVDNTRLTRCSHEHLRISPSIPWRGPRSR